MQQLPTIVGPAVHRREDTTHKSLETMCRQSRNKRNVRSCWLKGLTGFKLRVTTPTTSNDMQQQTTWCTSGRNMYHPRAGVGQDASVCTGPSYNNTMEKKSKIRGAVPFPRVTVASESIGSPLGSFSNDNGDGNGNEDVKNALRLLRKTTTLHVHHAFLYISWPSLHNYDVKMPNCKIYGGRKQATTNLFFSL